MWWSGNNIPSWVSNVIVWWKSIDVNYDNIFVYSPKNSFKPEEWSWFYLNVGKWLWINMQSEEWVASLWAVSFGDITCDSSNIWEIWEKDGCVVQCKSGGKWQMMDTSEKCINNCDGSNCLSPVPTCESAGNCEPPVVTWSCSDNLSGCKQKKVCKKYSASKSSGTIVVSDNAGNKATSPSFSVTINKAQAPCSLGVSSDGTVKATLRERKERVCTI